MDYENVILMCIIIALHVSLNSVKVSAIFWSLYSSILLSIGKNDALNILDSLARNLWGRSFYALFHIERAKRAWEINKLVANHHYSNYWLAFEDMLFLKEKLENFIEKLKCNLPTLLRKIC